MREVSVEANWEIVFPDQCDAAKVNRMLNEQRLYEWDWDTFIWDVPYLETILTEHPAEYDYLFVTRFLKARAAHLLLTETASISSTEVCEGIARHKLQYAAMYRHLFLNELRDVLAEFGEAASGIGARYFLTNIRRVEREYLRIVEAVALMPEAAEDFTNYPLCCWVDGELAHDSGCALLIPSPVTVRVRIDENFAYSTIRPCREEVLSGKPQHCRKGYFRECGTAITATDRDLQRMSQIPRNPDEIGAIDYDGSRIGYYRTYASKDKTTLTVVCADRTMILSQHGKYPPGTYPKRIYPGMILGGLAEEAYIVDFDNGVCDGYQIEIRAHAEDELPWVPQKRAVVGRARSVFSMNANGRKRERERLREMRERMYSRQRTDGSEEQPGNAGGVAVADRLQTAKTVDAVAEVELQAEPKERTVKIGDDYINIEIDGYVIDFYRKKKRREFVEFLHKRKLNTGVDEFFYDDAKQDYFEATGRTVESERLDDDLFKGQQKEFRLLFKVLDAKKKWYRIMI